MKRMNILLLMVILIVSCSIQKIKRNINSKFSIETNNQKIYISNIYRNKELGEVFWEKSKNEVLQLSKGKQNISSLLLDSGRNNLIYSQSQRKFLTPKILEPFLANTPSDFSDYKIFTYNLTDNTLTELFDLSKQDIIGSVNFLSFLKNGKILAFQTSYGEIFFLNLSNPSVAIRFKPETDFPNQMEFNLFFNMKTDGNNLLFFDARSGYKSESKSTFVYNTFQYNIDTKKTIRITENNFVF